MRALRMPMFARPPALRLPAGPGARAARWAAARLPRRTVRLRLTLMYGGLFLASGAALLAITYVLVTGSRGQVVAFSRGGPSGSLVGSLPGLPPQRLLQMHVLVNPNALRSSARGVSVAGASASGSSARTTAEPLPGGTFVKALPVPIDPKQVQQQARKLRVLATAQHNAELHRLLIESGIALAIMAIASMGLGWLLAGRALRPLHTITAATRAISASNLHERLALAGPNDELTELGAEIDGLLERLEASFSSQRQFVANASHELRTPLTFERALLEVALADPRADERSLRRACERVLAASVGQEQLIEALLTLASSERGIERADAVDLGALARSVLDSRLAQAELRGLRVHASVERAVCGGDPRLLERLLANLVDNALHHNERGGEVRVNTQMRDGRVWVEVANRGPAVPAGEVERLFEPFQRLGPERAGARDGHGLGLSIVRAIARAHGAELRAAARTGGGMAVELGFAAYSTSGQSIASASSSAPSSIRALRAIGS